MVTQSLVAHADCVSVIAMAIWVKLPLVRESTEVTRGRASLRPVKVEKCR